MTAGLSRTDTGHPHWPTKPESVSFHWVSTDGAVKPNRSAAAVAAPWVSIGRQNWLSVLCIRSPSTSRSHYWQWIGLVWDMKRILQGFFSNFSLQPRIIEFLMISFYVFIPLHFLYLFKFTSSHESLPLLHPLTPTPAWTFVCNFIFIFLFFLMYKKKLVASRDEGKAAAV